MTYGESTARAVKGDGLTGDHIPSYAAIRQNVENILDRQLTAEEAATLRNNTYTVVVGHDLHSIGRTYFGANTPAQGKIDAQDLLSAALRDQAVHLENASSLGYSATKLQTSFDQINQFNQSLFKQLLTEQSITKFFKNKGEH